MKSTIDWKLLLALSMFGLILGLAQVFVIPENREPLVWLPVFLVCAYVIARRTTRRFIHGLFLGLINCVWITSAELVFLDRYLAGHPTAAQMFGNAPDMTRLMVAIIGVVAGGISGVVIGVLALIAGKVLRPIPSPQSPRP